MALGCARGGSDLCFQLLWLMKIFTKAINESFGFTTPAKTGFSDLKSTHPYYKDLLIAKSAGYFASSSKINPNASVSKQEIAVIIARIMKPQTATATSELKKVKDSIPSWSAYAVASALKWGYMKVEKDGKFKPLQSITLSQANGIIQGALKGIVKSTYSKAGTYTSGKVYGTVRIDSKDVILKNATIYGNLIIGEKVGNGNVTLKNVVVKGDTVVKGGGLNSIILDGSKFSRIVVTKVDGKVRIVAMGTTTVSNVQMQSGGRLEATGTGNGGFENVVVEQTVDANEPIILSGNFESVDIQADGVNISLNSGSIDTLNVSNTAQNTALSVAGGAQVSTMNMGASVNLSGSGTVSQMTVQNASANLNVTGTAQINNLAVASTAGGANINLGAGSTVTNMVLNAQTNVGGAGTITNAQVNAAGSTISAPVTTVTSANNTPPPATTQPTNTTPVTTPTTSTSSSGGGGGGGGGGSSTVSVSPITNADVGITSGSVIFGYTFTAASGAVTYAQAKAAPYYLNETSSTVTLSDGAGGHTSVATVSSLGIADNGTVTYANLAAIQSKFSGLTFLPTEVVIHLVGASSVNGGANQWTKDVTVALEAGEITLLTPPAPTIASVVAAEAGASEAGLGAGDTLTITFNVPTNKTGADTYANKAAVDAILTFGASFGTDYSGAWTNNTTLVITSVNATGSAFAVGDTVTAKVGANIKTLGGASPASTDVSDASVGSFSPGTAASATITFGTPNAAASAVAASGTITFGTPNAAVTGVAASGTITFGTPNAAVIGVAASGTITFGVPVNGDTVVVNGTTFTKAVDNTGANFVDITDLTADIAAESNIGATHDGTTITITADAVGTGGNAYTLELTGTGTGTISGATLSGGVNAVTATTFVVNGTTLTRAGNNMGANFVNIADLTADIDALANVAATDDGTTITITAEATGTGGNAYTLALANGGAGCAVSGANLIGGVTAVTATTFVVNGTTFTRAANNTDANFVNIADLTADIDALANIGATDDGTTITITAEATGTGGNAYTLVLANGGAGCAVSGANLAGGAAAVVATTFTVNGTTFTRAANNTGANFVNIADLTSDIAALANIGATDNGTTITITADAIGVGGNAYTLSVANPGAGCAVSGANFTGGN